MPFPETRPSLLIRIRDPQDRLAWQEFETLYRDVVLRMAMRHGMQLADAEDLAQGVLWAIAKSISGFDVDSANAKFRTWLKTIARRAIINAVTRGPKDRAFGGDDAADLLEQQPAENEETQTLRLEYRREIFQVAAQQVQSQFDPATWQAFWRSTVQGEPPANVATDLGRSVGSVYTARSRVIAKLRQCVSELDLEQEGTP